MRLIRTEGILGGHLLGETWKLRWMMHHPVRGQMAQEGSLRSRISSILGLFHLTGWVDVQIPGQWISVIMHPGPLTTQSRWDRHRNVSRIWVWGQLSCMARGDDKPGCYDGSFSYGLGGSTIWQAQCTYISLSYAASIWLVHQGTHAVPICTAGHVPHTTRGSPLTLWLHIADAIVPWTIWVDIHAWHT